jgi:APA family basic amino acid/polyamine antiporter
MQCSSLVYLGAVYLGFGFVSDWEYGDLLDFVVIIVLIFYILTILESLSFVKKCQTWKDRIKHLDIQFYLYIIIASAICIALLYTKTSTSGWGVVIMLIGIPVYYLTKAKGSFF